MEATKSQPDPNVPRLVAPQGASRAWAEQSPSLTEPPCRRFDDHARDTAARRNLIRTLATAERHAEAVYQSALALALAPDDAEMHFLCGAALNAMRRPVAAHAALSKAVALEPRHAAAWLSLGNACVDLGDDADAERHFRTAIRLDPMMVEAHVSLGHVLIAQARPTEAIAACENAVRIGPDMAEAHWNLATSVLLSGDLRRGFREYEWRKRHRDFRAHYPALPGPGWDGGNPAGQVILVRAEQGFGDTIQFARYLALIVARGGTPLLRCDARLVPLLACMPGVVVLPNTARVEGYDCWVDQMSLPLLFGTDLATIPLAEGYLRPDPDRAAAWHGRLPSGRKVGVVWSGNSLNAANRRRSIAAATLAPLLSMQGVTFVNLQVGEWAGDAGLPDLSSRLTDFAETAAAIVNLDLVITVDTAVAHLAGALGVPTWLLLAYAPDWRWLLHRHDCPWYVSMRLFRQAAPGEWGNVVRQMVDLLRLRLSDMVQNFSSP